INNERDITKSFLETAEKWTRTNLKENAEAQEEVRNSIKKKLKEEEEFNVQEIAEDLFENDTVVKESFINYVKEEGGVDKVEVDKEWVEKKFKRIRLKIDKDIDLYLNEDAYSDNSRFEIKRNGDGTINMVIKHISNYIEK
ncbi:nucleoid-associated protein, partial [Clostridium botulinum]